MPIPQLRPKSSGSWRDYHNKPTRRPVKKKTSSYYLPSRKKSKKSKNLKGLFRRFLPTILILGALLLVFAFIYTAWVSRDLPNPNHLIEREVAQSTKIYDRSGEHVLYEVSGDEKRTLISLEDVPNYVEQATIALEDKNFYKHGAFSVWAMFRTAITNVIFRRSAGGSTLTQQFIKNAVLTPEKTISRKVKE
jgi:penicillin-binding protein 1A